MERFKHPRIHRLTVDVKEEADIKRAVDFIIGEEGRLDILVSNAGALCIGQYLSNFVNK